MSEKPVNIMILLSCFIYYISEMASFNGRNLYHYPPPSCVWGVDAVMFSKPSSSLSLSLSLSVIG